MRSFARPWCARGTSGYSIVEVLVAASLLSLLGLMVVRFLHPALRVSARSSARSTAAQQSLILGSRIERDLQSTAAAGFSYHSGPVTWLAVHPIVGADNQGRTLFSNDQVVVYRWDSSTNTMNRWEWPGGGVIDSPDLEPLRFDRPELEGLLLTPDAYRQEYLRVLQFEISWPSVAPPNVGSPLTLELTTSEPGDSSSAPETVEFKKQIQFRNRI